MSSKIFTDIGNILKTGDRIRKIRERLGLTQQELAGKVGVTAASINRYEKGRVPKRKDILNRIAELGNVTSEWILKGEGTAAPPATAEHAPVSYTLLSQDLDEDALAHVLLLARDWLRRHRDKISPRGEAKLIAKMYRHWLTDKEYPDDRVIAALRRAVERKEE